MTLIQDGYLLLTFGLQALVRITGSRWIRTRLSQSVSFLAFHLSKKSQPRLNALSLTFPEQPRHRLESISRAAFATFWFDFFCFPPIPAEAPELDEVEVRGIDRLREAVNRGQGVILWESNLFGFRNVAKKVLHRRGFQVVQIHAAHHYGGISTTNTRGNRLIQLIGSRQQKWECEYVEEIIHIPNSDSLVYTRRLQQALIRGKVVCSAGEGRRGHQFKPVRIMGLPREVATGLVSLSQITQAPIFPCFCTRGPDGSFTVHILEQIQLQGLDREAAQQAAADHFASSLEGLIRHYPGQYCGWR